MNSLITLDDPVFIGNDPEYPWQRCKMDFEHAEPYIALCKLFHYVSGKYFSDFEVLEESGYWEHRDDTVFINWMAKMDRQLRQLNHYLRNVLKYYSAHTTKI